MAKQNDLSRAQYYETYYKIDGQLREIKRQLRQEEGYPHDLHALKDHLQEAVEGKFSNQINGIITRTVSVDDTRTPQEVLDATGCAQYVDDEVVANMPRCKGGERKVYFIPYEMLPNMYKDGPWVRDGNLKQAVNELGYKLACPYAVAKINELDPYFALKHPNATQWKDKKDRWCYMGFDSPSPQRNEVSVYLVSTGLSASWYFATEKI